MKLIKKMLAIMFAFMMVVGMGTKVNAQGNESTTATTGTITIDNAVNGQTYSIYKVLELESYDEDNGLYSYKPVDAWEKFFQVEDAAGKEKGAGSDYVTIDENGYATWKNNADVKKFANLALEYAKSKSITPVTEQKIENQTLEFKGLEFGYYLVYSSVVALCGLDTTNPKVTIKEKNGTPTVVKQVKEDSKDTFESSNTADIGQTVEFKTTITAQAGAQNYVLHDKMDAGLTFNSNSVSVSLKKNDQDQATILPNDDNKNYVLKTSGLGETDPTCTFHIEFTKALCDSLDANDQIIVSYSATLNENAVVGNAGNKNDTWLKYGNGTDTAHSTTTTKTYEIPVFKYTGENTPLAGAKFTLSKNPNGSSPINLIKVKEETGNTKLTYRVAKEDETSAATEITTPSKGEFVIQGLDADTYYLTETEAPKGYNKLASPIKVEIKDDGTLKIDGQDNIDGVSITQVKVENKTGTLLPSTGGMGTTIIYMAGAILVIASGIVLVSKKRSKAK